MLRSRWRWWSGSTGAGSRWAARTSTACRPSLTRTWCWSPWTTGPACHHYHFLSLFSVLNFLHCRLHALGFLSFGNRLVSISIAKLILSLNQIWNIWNKQTNEPFSAILPYFQIMRREFSVFCVEPLQPTQGSWLVPLEPPKSPKRGPF